MGEEKGLLPSLDIVLDGTKAALNRQFEQSSSLDMKLGVSVGLSGVILAALLGFTFLYTCDTTTTWLVISAVALVLVSLLFAAWGVFLIGKFQWAPRPDALREFYLTKQSKETKIAIVDTQIYAYGWNRKRIARKAQLMRTSFIFVLVSAFIIGIAILYNLL